MSIQNSKQEYEILQRINDQKMMEQNQKFAEIENYYKNYANKEQNQIETKKR